MTAVEYNFDGLVGPTHHYAGLAYGNQASIKNRGVVSNPRAAALEGLEKMKLLQGLGIPQAILPPQERPCIPALRGLGFTGSDEAILASAFRKAPDVLAACSSASSMWAANAATISPSADTADKKVHITPANLRTNLHRSIEVSQTDVMLRKIFYGDCFVHHQPLTSEAFGGDEGAANHLRLCASHENMGIEMFVYGRSIHDPNGQRCYPARQSYETCKELIKAHHLNPDFSILAKQNPMAISAGVFHNDVIGVSNEDLLFIHELAFVDQQKVLEALVSKFRLLSGTELTIIQVADEKINLELAVKSYIFNSQIVTLPDATMAVICPEECRRTKDVDVFLEELELQENPISKVHYVPLFQSMKNGGGPACLRLRVVLTPEEQQGIHPGVILSETRFQELASWVRRYYRDTLTLEDFSDPRFLDETRQALDKLTQLLSLGSVYPFQREQGILQIF